MPIRFSPRLLPWLAIFGLCLLRPNRRFQAWLVWLPLLAVAALGVGFARWSGIDDEGFRVLAQRLPTALAFGWAAALLLAGSGSARRGPFMFLLLALGIFSVLSLATGHEWSGEMFMQFISPAALEFIVLSVVGALSFAARSMSRRFTMPRLFGWFALGSLVVWLAAGIPLVMLSVLANVQALTGVAGLVGFCWCISFGVTLPFLVLAAAAPEYRQRLQQLVHPSEPVPAVVPAPTLQTSLP